MILQIEDERKAGARELWFIPASVRSLMIDQPLDAARDGERNRARRKQQSEQGPGGLRSRRRPAARSSGLA